MPRIDDVVTSLTVLSRVQANQKLNTREGYLTVEQDTYVAYIRRMVSADGRSRTLDTLNTLYQEAFEILGRTAQLHRANQDPRDAVVVRSLCAALRDSLEGLANLRKTYAEDVGVQSRLEVFSRNVEAQVRAVAPEAAEDGPRAEEELRSDD